jgi:hypothetical protein
MALAVTTGVAAGIGAAREGATVEVTGACEVVQAKKAARVSGRKYRFIPGEDQG